VVLGFLEWNVVLWSFQHFLKWEMRSIFCSDLWKLSLNLENIIRISCDLKLWGFGVWNFGASFQKTKNILCQLFLVILVFEVFGCGLK
jgi:hypothetical protein